MIDEKQSEHELRNWGRCIHDGWLRDHLDYRPPPTSEQYQAPIVAFDDPEPVRAPHDELAAEMTTEIVVQIGLEHFDAYRTLVFWYTRLQQIPELGHDESIKRLSRHMKTGFDGATRMLNDARKRYLSHRLRNP